MRGGFRLVCTVHRERVSSKWFGSQGKPLICQQANFQTRWSIASTGCTFVAGILISRCPVSGHQFAWERDSFPRKGFTSHSFVPTQNSFRQSWFPGTRNRKLICRLHTFSHDHWVDDWQNMQPQSDLVFPSIPRRCSELKEQLAVLSSERNEVYSKKSPAQAKGNESLPSFGTLLISFALVPALILLRLAHPCDRFRLASWLRIFLVFYTNLKFSIALQTSPLIINIFGQTRWTNCCFWCETIPIKLIQINPLLELNTNSQYSLEWESTLKRIRFSYSLAPIKTNLACSFA